MLSGFPVLAQPFPVPVEVAAVVSQTVQEEVSFIATLEPDITTTVGAVVAGRVIRAEVREGDRVVRGKTLLMQIDRTSREIALRAAEASVAKNRERWEGLRRGYRQEEVAQRRAESEEQKAIRSRSEQDFKRGERLYRDDLISLAELERLQSEHLAAKEKHGRTLAALQMAEAGPRREVIAEAEAELREAKARYDLIVYELDRTTLRAPITGFLVRKYVEIGTWVKTGDPIADLVDLNPVYANGPVGERKISLLRKGLAASVVVDALPEQSFAGTGTQIVPRADPQSRTFPVKVRIANEDGRLKSGMLARVTVSVGNKHSVLLVPKDAVVRRGADEVVFVVDNGVAKRVKVKTGRAVQQLMEIQNSGLKPNQEVVIIGNESLTGGAKVRKVNRKDQGQAPKF
jgi:multidrug resistance efflux pump